MAAPTAAEVSAVVEYVAEKEELHHLGVATVKMATARAWYKSSSELEG